METLPYAVGPAHRRAGRCRRAPRWLAVLVMAALALATATIAYAFAGDPGGGSSGPSTPPTTSQPSAPSQPAPGATPGTGTSTSPPATTTPESTDANANNSNDTGGSQTGHDGNTVIDSETGRPRQETETEREANGTTGSAQEQAQGQGKDAGEQARQEVEEASGGKVTDDTVIYGNPPSFELSGDFFLRIVAYELFTLVHSMASAVMDLCGFLLGILDRATSPLLTADWAGGAFGRLYSAASAVASTVGIPFGMAICGMSLMVALNSVTDRMRRADARGQGLALLMLGLAFAVSVALVYHAVDIAGAIYWLATRLVAMLRAALAAAGVPVTVDGSIGEALKSSVMGGMEGLTYGQSGAILIYLIVALAMAFMCFGCMTYVILQALLRMAECYLRASFAPIAVAFAASDKTRPIAVNYLKRFAAVAFSAGLIVMSLALAGLLFDVASGIIGPLVQGGDGTVAGVIGGLVPTVVCVTAVTAIVKRTETISANLFGLAQ